MAWDDVVADTDAASHAESIELVGTHLRLTGTLQLGRFSRLTDFINAARGFIKIHDVRLVLPDGTPTDVSMPELLIDEDEITFIGQQSAPEPDPGIAVGFVESKFDPSAAVRKPRELVMFTSGHSVTGKVHLFGQTDVAGFVDASDPRFIAVTEATMRALDDARIVSTYQFVLLNRNQMIAASEVPDQDGASPGAAAEWPAEDTARVAEQ